jgi:hypothetical protein
MVEKPDTGDERQRREQTRAARRQSGLPPERQEADAEPDRPETYAEPDRPETYAKPDRAGEADRTDRRHGGGAGDPRSDAEGRP